MRAAPVLVFAILVGSCGGKADHEMHPEEYDENGDWIYSEDSSHFDDMARDRGFDSYEEMDEYDQENGNPPYD